MVEDGRGLSSPLPHVALHGVELGHGPTVRLPRRSFDHVAAVLRSPKGGVTAQTRNGAVTTFHFYRSTWKEAIEKTDLRIAVTFRIEWTVAGVSL